jgi:hypothetical protein
MSENFKYLWLGLSAYFIQMVFPASSAVSSDDPEIRAFGSLSFTFEEFIMEFLDLASSCIHLSDRIVDCVFRSTFPKLRQHGIRCGFAFIPSF